MFKHFAFPDTFIIREVLITFNSNYLRLVDYLWVNLFLHQYFQPPVLASFLPM